MQEYKAYFEIDGAVSHGFGLKEPSVYNEEVQFSAKDDSRAFKMSIYKAAKIAINGLTNPHTNNIEVALLRLERDGETLNIKRRAKVSSSTYFNLMADIDPKLVSKFKKSIREKLSKVA